MNIMGASGKSASAPAPAVVDTATLATGGGGGAGPSAKASGKDDALNTFSIVPGAAAAPKSTVSEHVSRRIKDVVVGTSTTLQRGASFRVTPLLDAGGESKNRSSSPRVTPSNDEKEGGPLSAQNRSGGAIAAASVVVAKLELPAATAATATNEASAAASGKSSGISGGAISSTIARLMKSGSVRVRGPASNRQEKDILRLTASDDINQDLLKEFAQNFCKDGEIVDERYLNDFLVPLPDECAFMSSSGDGGQLTSSSGARHEAAAMTFLEELQQRQQMLSRYSKLADHTGGNRHFLVVDDSPTVRTDIQRALVNEGQEVSVAIDGVDCLKVYDELLKAERRVDVVLMDSDMPFMPGTEAIKKLRARGYPNLIILLLDDIDINSSSDSVDARRASVQKGACAGIDAVIQKPFTLTKLELKLSELC
jgi:CheY-like chemotaxis protein